LFYLTQYSISNLNAFFILIAIGFYYAPNSYTLLFNKDYSSQTNINSYFHSPIQLISQLKGYFYVNPYLTLSLAFTIFSFAGIPPLIGFFGKQIVLNAALNKGFLFLSIVIITTSVIGALYYLNIIENMFFYLCPVQGKSFIYGTIPNFISGTISIISMIILLFILSNQE
jgi:NADH-ubiquinone oxidoreductase chain 2